MTFNSKFIAWKNNNKMTHEQGLSFQRISMPPSAALFGLLPYQLQASLL
jgi:hypothetical protein